MIAFNSTNQQYQKQDDVDFTSYTEEAKGEIIVNIILSLVLGEISQLINSSQKFPHVKVKFVHGHFKEKLVFVALEVGEVERFGAAKVSDVGSLQSVLIALAEAMFMALENIFQSFVSDKTKLDKYKQGLKTKSAYLRFTKAICL